MISIYRRKQASEPSHYRMTSWSGNIFRVTGPLFGEFTGHRWIPLTKARDAGLWCFLLSAPWINGWVKNNKAGDLRRHRAHYDVIVMIDSSKGFPCARKQSQGRLIVDWTPRNNFFMKLVSNYISFQLWYIWKCRLQMAAIALYLEELM